jgi:hypothetical protein
MDPGSREAQSSLSVSKGRNDSLESSYSKFSAAANLKGESTAGLP